MSAVEYPHCPAAFINALAEEGSKAEAIEWLQKTWNELRYKSERLDALMQQVASLEAKAADWHRVADSRSAEINRLEAENERLRALKGAK